MNDYYNYEGHNGSLSTTTLHDLMTGLIAGATLIGGAGATFPEMVLCIIALRSES